jgi:hypothetical protein
MELGAWLLEWRTAERSESAMDTEKSRKNKRRNGQGAGHLPERAADCSRGCGVG